MPPLPLPSLPFKLWLVTGALAGGAGTASACDAVLADIDAKIRASGATGYGLLVVGANEPSSGRVVGSCGLGSKKIVYVPGAGATSAAAPGVRAGSGLITGGTMSAPVVRSAHSRPLPGGDILTECKPGFVGPDCRRRPVAAVAPASASGGADPAEPAGKATPAAPAAPAPAAAATAPSSLP